MKPLLITHPDCLNHMMPRHPERPERLTAVLEQLTKTGIRQDMHEILAVEIDTKQLSLVHDKAHVKYVFDSAPGSGCHKIEQDTYMSPGSLRAARLAAGALVQATEAVLAGQTKRVFCAIRPPGHHAEIKEAFGFCLFNNVAIAAQTALLNADINRVAILDFDVHHCNGTVDIFKDNEDVLVCSSFQEDFYPNRFLDFENAHIISSRLASGTEGQAFRHLIEAQWLPALQKHKPDIIFVSAGFDAHKQDPLGEVCLTETDYEWLADLIKDQANSHSQGRIISTLEGGYDLDSLKHSAAAYLQRLLA